MQQREPDEQLKPRPQARQRAYRGPWFPRQLQKTGRFAGQQRFVKFTDEQTLVIMGCCFDGAATWAVLWAMLWKQQSTHPTDADEPVDISIDELMRVTGYSRAAIYRGVVELTSRSMVGRESGGGRHRKSKFRLTDLDEWVL